MPFFFFSLVVLYTQRLFLRGLCVYFFCLFFVGLGFMMRDKKAFRISSFLPYVLGFFLAVGVFYVVKYTEFFEANLLSIVEQDYFKKQDWDIAYKTYDGVLDVYVAEDLQ